MAEKIVSPGVFTNEKDLSFLPAGIAAIGAAIVGPTTKGPAFVPTVVSSFDDFITKFGGLSEETYVPYAVKSYLRNASAVTVVRVLQEGGYLVNGAFELIYSGSGGLRTIAVVVPSAKANSGNGSNGTNLTGSVISIDGNAVSGSASSSFALTLVGNGVSTFNVSASVVPSSNVSIDKVLGTNIKSNQNAYTYLWFGDFMSASFSAAGAKVSSSRVSSFNLSGSDAGTYRAAKTPYITSQLIAGQTNPTNLFRFYTLADGTDTNTSVKISVINQTLPTATAYGTFTVLVRDYNDTDQRPLVLESFNNLDLDPNSPNFIARRIGDRYNTINTVDNTVNTLGDYPNVSKYIRVDVDSDVKVGGTSLALYPKGFASVLQTFQGIANLPTASYITKNTVINGSYNKRAYYGWDFSAIDNKNYNKPVPFTATAGGNVYFNLDNCTVHPSASKVDSNSTFTGGSAISSTTFRGLDVSNVLKFTVPFQDGFDGDDPGRTKKVGSSIVSTNVFGMDCSTANANGSLAYNKALSILENQDQYDMNLLITPGITIADHSSVVAKAIDVAETRGDTFYIVDPVTLGTGASNGPATAIAAVANSGIDSSYIGTYWPWVKIIDTDKNKPVWVPPSVVLPNIYAYNDNVAFEWFAPAGLNRGGITEAVDVEAKLSFAQRDSLYEAKINPIATFPGQGICVWGQKTLQVQSSALDRVNVRRLLIALKKFIASSTRYLVFENNTTETRQRFLNIVNPYLERVKARQGLYAFRVVMDETNNTPDVIDRNQMYGQIFLQPAKTAEFIILDFNILPTGASFENA